MPRKPNRIQKPKLSHFAVCQHHDKGAGIILEVLTTDQQRAIRMFEAVLKVPVQLHPSRKPPSFWIIEFVDLDWAGKLTPNEIRYIRKPY